MRPGQLILDFTLTPELKISLFQKMKLKTLNISGGLASFVFFYLPKKVGKNL
jgi:hypothetical protein